MKNCLALAAAVVGFGASAGSAHAQLASEFYAPVLPYELSAPQYFEGLYAGVTLGMSGADHGNFFPGGGIDRYGVGGIVGWNHYIAPGVIAGAEVQAHFDSDLAGAYNTAALVLGRVGFATADDFVVHLLGGGGMFSGVPAWAFGFGIEAGVYDNMSIRADIITLGQAGPSPHGPDIDGVTAWIIKGGPVWHFGADGAAMPGWHPIPAPSGNVTDFVGPYAGLGYGVHINPDYSFFPDTGYGLHLTRGHIGGHAGWNFAVADGIVAGVEGQADLLFDTSGDMTFDALALGRVGVTPMPGLLAYGAGGVGVLQNQTTYALGGGLEYALWDQAALRAEALAIGALAGPAAPAATKVTFGATWYLD